MSVLVQNGARVYHLLNTVGDCEDLARSVYVGGNLGKNRRVIDFVLNDYGVCLRQ